MRKRIILAGIFSFSPEFAVILGWQRDPMFLSTLYILSALTLWNAHRLHQLSLPS